MRTDVPPHSLLAKRRATRPGVERGAPIASSASTCREVSSASRRREKDARPRGGASTVGGGRDPPPPPPAAARHNTRSSSETCKC